MLISGLFLLFSSAVLTWISFLFIPDVPPTAFAMISFLVTIAFMFGAYYFSICLIARKSYVHSAHAIQLILVVGILARFILLWSTPIQETDPFRYIWDGQVVQAGGNPYRYSPQEAKQRDLFNQMDHDRREAVYRHINYPEVRTIYPPLAQAAFWFAQKLNPWHWHGWRMLIFLLEIATMLLLVSLLTKRFQLPEWVLVYAWSPLVLKECINSMHVDVLVVFLMVSLLMALHHHRFILAFLMLALAVLAKLSPIVLLPILLVWCWPLHQRQTAMGMGVFLGTLLVGYLPFWDAGMLIWDGFLIFAQTWQVNDSVFSVAAGLLRFLLGGDELSSLFYTRALMALMLVVSFGFIIRYRLRPGDQDSFIEASILTLAALFFFSPTGNPWYFLWILPFLVLRPIGSLLIFSGLVFLYYLNFYFYEHGTISPFPWVQLIEYGVFAFLVTREAWIKKQLLPLLCPSAMSRK